MYVCMYVYVNYAEFMYYENLAIYKSCTYLIKVKILSVNSSNDSCLDYLVFFAQIL